MIYPIFSIPFVHQINQSINASKFSSHDSIIQRCMYHVIVVFTSWLHPLHTCTALIDHWDFLG
jgi:hypothetical protein